MITKIKAIMAMDKNGLVGNDKSLPWAGDKDTKWDMDYFKETTTNGVVIMGYNTYMGFKRPLKNRLNLVLARPNENEQFYSVKDNKLVYDDLELNSSSSELDIATDECSFPYKNENNDNSSINKVNLTKHKLDSLFNIIPLDSIDYRFVYISSNSLSKENYIYEFDHLSRNFKALQEIAIDNYNKSNCNNDSISKIKNFNPNEIFIIGGLKTYYDYLDIIDEFIITEFNNKYSGNIYFDKNILNKFRKSEIIYEEPSRLGKITRYYDKEK